MPAEISTDAVGILSFLLPGFLASWLFYVLTSHAKPSQFERVTEALIFTFLVQAFLPVLRWCCEWAGSYFSLGDWGKESELTSSLFLAVLLGVLVAYLTNNDSFHGWLRTKGFTSRTSYPSEWYCVLSRVVTYVVLHFHDGRRLYGWPKEWPIDSDKGQFYIQDPMWIDESGRYIDMTELEGIIVRVQDVRWVEFCVRETSSGGE